MLVAVAFFSYIAIFILLGALAYRDLREYILPDRLNAALAVSYIIFHMATEWQIIQPFSAILGAATGGGMLLSIRYVANRFYKQDSLGLGDVKLMTAAGLGLGFPNVMLALCIGAFAGVVHGVAVALIMERRTGKKQSLGETQVPAGLGLAAGIAIVMLTQFGTGWFGEK